MTFSNFQIPRDFISRTMQPDFFCFQSVLFVLLLSTTFVLFTFSVSFLAEIVIQLKSNRRLPTKATVNKSRTKTSLPLLSHFPPFSPPLSLCLSSPSLFLFTSLSLTETLVERFSHTRTRSLFLIFSLSH